MSDELQSIPPGRTCSYCGLELRADYYFCPACSKPWRSGEAGLGPAPEPVWDNETRIRKRAPEAYHLFLCYLAAVLMAVVLGVILSGGPHADVNFLVLTAIAVTAVTVWASRKHWEVLSPILKRPGLTHPAFFAGLLLGAALVGLNLVYHGLMEQWFHHELGEGAEDRMEFFGNNLSLPAAFFLWCLVPAITEETGFRGLMQTFLLRALTPRKAIFVSSLLFAAAHLSVISFPYLLLVGILLGWLLQKTGSIYPGIVIHAAHNFVIILHATS